MNFKHLALILMVITAVKSELKDIKDEDEYLNEDEEEEINLADLFPDDLDEYELDVKREQVIFIACNLLADDTFTEIDNLNIDYYIDEDIDTDMIVNKLNAIIYTQCKNNMTYDKAKEYIYSYAFDRYNISKIREQFKIDYEYIFKDRTNLILTKEEEAALNYTDSYFDQEIYSDSYIDNIDDLEIDLDNLIAKAAMKIIEKIETNDNYEEKEEPYRYIAYI